MARPNNTEAHFWRHIRKTATCWLWVDHVEGMGYGRFRIAGKKYRAHRYSYELAHGPVPDDLVVAHRCDEPRCVRPSHLFVATQAENIADKTRKGRQARGERTNTAKLTEAQVRAIRRHPVLAGAAIALAREYGVTRNAIDAILQRRTWKHIL